MGLVGFYLHNLLSEAGRCMNSALTSNHFSTQEFSLCFGYWRKVTHSNLTVSRKVHFLWGEAILTSFRETHRILCLQWNSAGIRERGWLGLRTRRCYTEVGLHLMMQLPHLRVCGDAGSQRWFLGKAQSKASYRIRASASLGQEKKVPNEACPRKSSRAWGVGVTGSVPPNRKSRAQEYEGRAGMGSR